MKRVKTRKLRPHKRSCRSAANFGFGTPVQDGLSDAFNNESVSFANLNTSGRPVNHVSFGKSPARIRLHGKTVANYDNGTGNVINQKAEHAKDCSGCDDSKCITWSGTLQLTFLASPTIALPGPSKYAHLSPCQQERVKAWIQDVLLPHEKQHKAAFEKYNGTVNKPFSMKICQRKMGAELVQHLHDAEEIRRRTLADNASDALDPFHSNIDLDCEDKKESNNGDTNIPSINS